MRRHSVNVLRFFAETEETMLSVRTKRATMDFSLLSVPCVPESALHASVSLQVQSASFPHTVILPLRSVPPGNVRVCVCVCVCPKPSKPLSLPDDSQAWTCLFSGHKADLQGASQGLSLLFFQMLISMHASGISRLLTSFHVCCHFFCLH